MKEGADLKQLVGYQVQRADLLLNADARDALAAHDLSPAKLTALILIRDNPGSDQTALGRALSINRSSAMKLVNLLVERNLVERRPGRNLRTNALHLTGEGETLVPQMLEALRQSDAKMTSALSADEVRTLIGLLRKLGHSAGKSRANRKA